METILTETEIIKEAELKGINLWVNKTIRNEELGTWDPIKFWTVDGVNGWVEMPIIDEATGRIKSWFRRPVEDRRIIEFFYHDEDGINGWEEPYEAEALDNRIMKEWAMITPETLSEAEYEIEEIRNSLATKFRIKESRWKRDQKKRLSLQDNFYDFEGIIEVIE